MVRVCGPRVWGIVLCFLFSSSLFASLSIRAPGTPCGIYLAVQENDTVGKKLTDKWDTEELQKKLEERKTPLDPAKDKIVAVGVPFEREARKEIERRITTTLEEMGYRDVPVMMVRRLTSFIADQVGVFAVDPSGDVRKVSTLDPSDIRASIVAKVDAHDSLLVVGEPLFGKSRLAIRNAVDMARAEGQVDWDAKYEKAPVTMLKKALQHPLKAAQHFAYSVRSVLPLPEDWQRPTREELQQMGQKLVVPGILTFTVLLSQDKPLEILIPVTMANAFNSALNGTFRTAIGNWWNRSKTVFPSLLSKQVMMGTFFTGVLYLAGRGSVQNLLDTLTMAGWINFISSQWLTVVFNTSWRSPFHTSVYKWERWRVANDPTTLANVAARAQGSAIEKYVSYVMTQFYIYSVMAQESFFKVISSSDGLGVTTGQVDPASAHVLLSFNSGHLAMIGVGLFSFLAAHNIHWLNPIADVAIKINGYETKIWNIFKRSHRESNPPKH